MKLKIFIKQNIKKQILIKYVQIKSRSIKNVLNIVE